MSTPIPETYLVAVDAPLGEALHYLPPEDGQLVHVGQSVWVPLGKRQANGVVLKPWHEPVEFKLRPIIGSRADRPALPPPYLDWLQWLAHYYIAPIGQVVEMVFPPLERESKRASRKAPIIQPGLEPTARPQLTVEQQKVLASIQERADFQVHLLHGVTGSGKTEVYLQLLETTLAAGLQGLVLVPEIALTPQLIDRFSRRFPDQVAVLHSHLTNREKTTQWWLSHTGEKKILIGARSALFCPLPHLGLIILDEEHEPSYKQDEQLKYHARDAAIMLARGLNRPIVLGSATPSLESWANVRSGKFRLHTMAERVNARALPSIEIVDLRAVTQKRKDEHSTLPFWLSDTLFAELNAVFARGDQAALFLNRRGVAQTAQCRSCGFAVECPNCSVSLTLHGQSHLVCHYCDYSERLKELCPNCKEGAMLPLGLGTERIESEMAALFPHIRMARADRDEIQSREHLETLIRSVEQREVDLLIGTQMIAKGLDFPHLNLVGLVLADVGFHWPDFRASERSFQLLTQVSGRSGRQTAGKVVIQTYDPSHPSVQHTLNADYPGFATLELSEREELFYPPFWRMAMWRIQGSHLERVQVTAQRLVQRAQMLQKQSPRYQQDVLILGPAKAPLFKLRNKFRFQVIVKCAQAQSLNHFCRQILANDKWIEAGTKVQVDIDPFQML